MTGERRLPASPERVWAALNDPEILRDAIPGCRALGAVGDRVFKATAGVLVGPLPTDFVGEVRLFELERSRSYRMEGAGHGGPAGAVSGAARVLLAPDGPDTILTYEMAAEINSQLAPLGMTSLEAGAQEVADLFFGRLERAITVPHTALVDPDRRRAPVRVGLPLPRVIMGYPLIAWASAAVFVLIAVSILSPYLPGL